MSRQLDVLFVNPGDQYKLYQGLRNKMTGIEPPVWCMLLAQSCRSKGYGTAILDCDAEELTHDQAIQRIIDINPKLVTFVPMGGNPNSGTTKMYGCVELAKKLRQSYPEYFINFVGSHTSALPREVLSYEFIDFIMPGDGVYALHSLLRSDFKTDLANIKGIGWKNDTVPQLNEAEKVVPNDRMDIDLPGYAWDLLPFKKSPLDLYRSGNWHANYIEKDRMPYGCLYTSLGCQFKCDFCMINVVNRDDYTEGKHAANFNRMRFWSPEFIIKEFDKLASFGVRTIKVADEMFFLNAKYFKPLCDLLAQRDYAKELNIWTYSRIDTVREKFLDDIYKAGIKWLALGIESIDQKVRQEITKGSYKEVDIKEVINLIKGHGISIIANYLCGLPDDNYETMMKTLDAALELCTETINVYACSALPGSPLYYEAIEKGIDLPQSFEEWSFLSYECKPLPTKYLTAAEVLKFRDFFWKTYFTYEPYLSMMEKKFGKECVENIKEMTKIKLKRKLLGDA